MKKSGFTLVEILIVVIILGILAAIVIPQFTEASNDARESALVSDLQTVRSQVELYKVQHLERLPGASGTNSFDAAVFNTQLTSRTNSSGTAMPTGGALSDYPFGPYLQKFPTNGFVTGTNAYGVSGVTADPSSAGSTGWWFNYTTGKFGAYDAAHLSK